MTSGSRLLLVDDDLALRQSLGEQLRLNGEFQTAEVGTAAEALQITLEQAFDAILLDIGLPDMDGRDLCRELRSRHVRCPIIMLTGASTDTDMIEGLEAGANDYISKPFRLGVLLARLHTQLRQFEHSDEAVFHIGSYNFQPSLRLLHEPQRNQKIRLTEKETQILKFLLRAGAKPVSREALLGEIWGYNAGIATHTLETHIYRLRQKIERDPASAEILITEAGGYRLVP